MINENATDSSGIIASLIRFVCISVKRQRRKSGVAAHQMFKSSNWLKQLFSDYAHCLRESIIHYDQLLFSYSHMQTCLTSAASWALLLWKIQKAYIEPKK